MMTTSPLPSLLLSLLLVVIIHNSPALPLIVPSRPPSALLARSSTTPRRKTRRSRPLCLLWWRGCSACWPRWGWSPSSAARGAAPQSMWRRRCEGGGEARAAAPQTRACREVLHLSAARTPCKLRIPVNAALKLLSND